MLKRTPFYNIHKQLNARIVEFAGFEMPVEYSGIKDEHLTVRNGVGVFDVSHMGEIWIKGPHALSLIQKVTTNDSSVLEPGQAQYSCFPNGKGGIVDDLLVYHFEPEKYMLVVNSSNTDKDYEWVVSQNSFGAEIENASDNISLLAIQGPKAQNVLQKLTAINLSTIKYYHFKVGQFAGIDNVIISATGYTGAGGFELYFYNENAEHTS
jgi:aminomethyltransferase